MDKKFTFKFQTVLNLRTKQEDVKKNDVGFATKKHQKETNTLLVMKKKEEKMIVKWRDETQKRLKIADLRRFADEFEYIKMRIDDQNNIVKKSEKRVEQEIELLIEAKKQRKIFDKLREKYYDDFKYNCLKDEEMLVDQIVTFKTASSSRG
ncbi:flagellar export protein FliJ [bacterium AH-315-G05]|nr:flagellar export protein FliJ [Alkaliphilus transvaalensis]MBN4069412.1 flagellar export protein FliJ [bacterium AH-315-G05]